MHLLSSDPCRSLDSLQNVSPVSLTFHFSELICGGVLVSLFWFVVLWFLCVCWGSFLSLLGSCPSDVLVLEPAAFCYERPRGRVACLASLQCSLCFHLFRVNAVIRFTRCQGLLCWWCFWLWCLLGGLVCLLSLCFFACLRSFTDWCIAHRQQSREQKKDRTSRCLCTRMMHHGHAMIFSSSAPICPLNGLWPGQAWTFLLSPPVFPECFSSGSGKNPQWAAAHRSMA